MSNETKTLGLIQKHVNNEKDIINALESIDFSQSVIIGNILVTKWVETFELNTISGKKENSYSTSDLDIVAKKILNENILKRS